MSYCHSILPFVFLLEPQTKAITRGMSGLSSKIDCSQVLRTLGRVGRRQHISERDAASFSQLNSDSALSVFLSYAPLFFSQTLFHPGQSSREGSECRDQTLSLALEYAHSTGACLGPLQPQETSDSHSEIELEVRQLWQYAWNAMLSLVGVSNGVLIVQSAEWRDRMML